MLRYHIKFSVGPSVGNAHCFDCVLKADSRALMLSHTVVTCWSLMGQLNLYTNNQPTNQPTKQASKQAKKTNKQTKKQTNKKTNKQKQTNKQTKTNKQTNRKDPRSFSSTTNSEQLKSNQCRLSQPFCQ